MTGQIKDYNVARAFGFITPQSGGPPLFFHITDVKQRWDIQPGDAVQYEQQQSDKGPKAVQVVKRCAEINSLAPSDGERAGVRGTI